MDINKIIYSNESTNLTELCSAGDVHNISDLNIYGRELIPQRHLEKLILDKKITYTRFSKGQSPFTAIFVDRNKYPDRFFTLEFCIAEINDEHIVVSCSEKFEVTNGKNGGNRLVIKEFPNFAKIKFIKRKDININGCIGDAAIVIYDVGTTCDIAYTDPIEVAKANFGRFALSIGLSLFVEMDGDWNKIIEDSNKNLMPVSEKLSNAKKENVMLKEDNKNKEIEIKNLNQEKNELNSLVKEMEDRLQDYQQEIETTRKWANEVFRFDGNGGENLDISKKEDWAKFQSRFLEVAEKLKDSDLKTDKKHKLKNLKKALKKKYLKFDESDLSFLATGEYLLEIHKEDNIDFSPMLIDFAKCLEDVLAKFLIKKLVIPEYEKPMLGNSLIYIKENPRLTGLSRTQTKDLTEKLQAFIHYRNDAVHKERVTLDDVLKAKDILLGEFDSYSQNYLLDFIHSYY